MPTPENVISRHRTRAMARLIEASLERSQRKVQIHGWSPVGKPPTRAERHLIDNAVGFDDEILVRPAIAGEDAKWVVISRVRVPRD